jgi:uncharacterized phage protein gp47/JayE
MMGPDKEPNSEETARSILTRLRTLEAEVRRLTDLAAKDEDEKRRCQYWDLARDVQAEARKVRMVLANLPPIRDEAQVESTLRRVLKALGSRTSATAMRT